MPRKHDADEILEHMQQLPSSLGLDRNRRFWSRWLFRSDHVENAARILNSGRLLSRTAAERGGLIPMDSGSPQYVGQLSPRHRNLVRLYFRPRTPTQYANEGIRPRIRVQYGAHMPVPVYLLFSASLLALQGVRFTRGRLAQGTAVGGSARFLKSISGAGVRWSPIAPHASHQQIHRVDLCICPGATIMIREDDIRVVRVVVGRGVLYAATQFTSR